MPGTLKTFYDDLYAKNPSIFGDSSRAWLEQVFRLVPLNGGRALDIGAGEGLTSLFLSENGYEVDAVDLSEKAFRAARDHGMIHLHQAAIENVNLVQTYDLVYVALTAHHLAAPLFVQTVQNVQRHTKAGGVHLLRIFTQASDFFIHSDHANFFDDGANLNSLYEGWKVLADERVISQASTQQAINEIRQVVFQKPI